MRFNPDDYETVEQRLARFWAAHPNGRVETLLLSPAHDIEECIIRAEIYFSADETRPRGVGHASERRNTGGANNGAHLENCETSSIGRALANCGFSGNKRASREEMQKVSRQPAPSSVPANGTNGRERAQQAVTNAERPLVTDQPTPGHTEARNRVWAAYKATGRSTDPDAFREFMSGLLQRPFLGWKHCTEGELRGLLVDIANAPLPEPDLFGGDAGALPTTSGLGH